MEIISSNLLGKTTEKYSEVNKMDYGTYKLLSDIDEKLDLVLLKLYPEEEQKDGKEKK